MRVPASLLAIPLVAGAATGILGGDGAGGALDLTACWCALLALAAGSASFVDRDAAGVAAAVAAGCLAAGLSLGLTSARAVYRPPLLEWFEAHQQDGPVVLEGRLREDGALTDYGATLTLDVRAIVSRDPAGVERLTPTAGGVRLAVTGAAAPAHLDRWRAGRVVRLPATLRLPSTYRNPGASDERKATARRGVVLVGTVKSAALVEVTRKGSRVEEAAAAVRSWTRGVLSRRVGAHQPRSAGVASAILIGDRSALPEEDERRLQEAGTYHVIAISGGNIAILTTLLVGTLRVVRVPQRAAAVVTIAALVFYAEVTGAPASVGRAVIAAVVYLAGRILDHQGAPLNALAVAAVCAVAWSPLAALDPGFILSFGATAGILLGTPHLVKWPERRARTRRARMLRAALLAPAALIAASLCAEIVLGPVSAALFSRVTVAGLVLNLAAIPLMGAVQGASLATLAADTLSDPAARLLGRIVHHAAFGLVESSRLLELAPWLSREVAPPAWEVVAGYYIAWGVAAAARRPAFAASLLRRGRRADVRRADMRRANVRRAGVPRANVPRADAPRAPGTVMDLALVAVVMTAAVIAIGPPHWTRGAMARQPAGVVRVAVLDVGQGDATAVVFPDGRALLVDAGGLPGTSFDVGERVVTPALRALGIRTLEELVITHADPDHLGGALSIVRQFTPRVVREGVPVPRHEGLRALEAASAARCGIWRVTQAGDVDRLGGASLRVHHPPPPDWERQRVRNDDSVVLEVRLGDVSIVLPGDIGGEPERAIVRRLDLAPLVVVKAAHHGSATSSTKEFIDKVRPAAAIVSAGANNRFGHPAPAVVERLRKGGAVIFQTSVDGAVIVETDGRGVEIRGWTGRRVIFQQSSQSR